MKSTSQRLFLSLLAIAMALGSQLQAAPQLGIQTWTCRNMTFEEAVEFAAAQGVTQLQLFRKHLDPASSKEELLAKRAFLKQHGVTAYSIGVSRTSPDREANRPLFELAKLFGMKVIVVEPRDPADWASLEELVREYDIKLAIHNHGTGTVFGNPATVKAVLAERDHRIGVCLDIGWATAAGFDAASVFKNYGDRVYDMHLKDKRLDQEDSPGRPTDTMIGLGNTNYADLIEAMKARDWTGVMAIETDSATFAEDPTEFVSRAKVFFDAHFSNK